MNWIKSSSLTDCTGPIQEYATPTLVSCKTAYAMQTIYTISYISNNHQWKMLPFPTQPGQVGGHEGVGKIVKLGPGAESSGLKIGDRVGIKWVYSACGNCRMFCHPIFAPIFLTRCSTLPSWIRRTLLQSKSFRILYSGNIPAICPRSR